jgi:hypothetical protein
LRVRPARDTRTCISARLSGGVGVAEDPDMRTSVPLLQLCWDPIGSGVSLQAAAARVPVKWWKQRCRAGGAERQASLARPGRATWWGDGIMLSLRVAGEAIAVRVRLLRVRIAQVCARVGIASPRARNGSTARPCPHSPGCPRSPGCPARPGTTLGVDRTRPRMAAFILGQLLRTTLPPCG